MALAVAATFLASCASRNVGSQRSALAASSTATFMHAGFGAGPVVFTDATGHLVEERRYEPFGAPVDAHVRDSGGDRIGAPDLVARDLDPLGRRSEATTGWSDHGARWLAPETGRWLTPDPAVVGPGRQLMSAPWALHPYQYVNQNPLAFWDPDGRQAAPVLSPAPPPAPPLVRPPLTLVPPAPPPTPGVFARIGSAVSSVVTPVVAGVAAGVFAFFYDESETGGPNDSCQHGCSQTSSVPAPAPGPGPLPAPAPDDGDRRERQESYAMRVRVALAGTSVVGWPIESPVPITTRWVLATARALITNEAQILAAGGVDPRRYGASYDLALKNLASTLSAIPPTGVARPGVVAKGASSAVTILVENLEGHNLTQ